MTKQRRRPLRLILLSALAGAIVLAILYLRCGPGGFGIGGGKGDGVGKGESETGKRTGTGGTAAKPPCQLRLDAAGVTVDGKRATIGDAVNRCKAAGGADLTVTGDAAHGTREDLREELRGAGVRVLER